MVAWNIIHSVTNSKGYGSRRYKGASKDHGGSLLQHWEKKLEGSGRILRAVPGE